MISTCEQHFQKFFLEVAKTAVTRTKLKPSRSVPIIGEEKVQNSFQNDN